MPCHEADIGLYFFVIVQETIAVCGHEDAERKIPLTVKLRCPKKKMGEGNERHARHDTKDEKKTLVWAFYFNRVRGLKLSRSDSAWPRVRQKTS